MNILVSACLLGVNCRYNAVRKEDKMALKLMEKYTVIPFCPEVYGGLPTPRIPGERVGNNVIGKDGSDLTKYYIEGGKEAVRLALMYGCKFAVLKERSPSCGHGKIYDGSFTGRLVEGDGITAELLDRAGIKVYGESDIPDLLQD